MKNIFSRLLLVVLVLGLAFSGLFSFPNTTNAKTCKEGGKPDAQGICHGESVCKPSDLMGKDGVCHANPNYKPEAPGEEPPMEEPCDEDRQELAKLKGEKAQLATQVKAVKLANDTVQKEMRRLIIEYIKKSTATTTATTTNPNATSTASTSQPISVSISPATLKAGATLDAVITFRSKSTLTYAIDIFKAGTLFTTITSGEIIPSATRPVTVKKSYRIPANLATGAYDFVVRDVITKTSKASARFTVVQ